MSKSLRALGRALLTALRVGFVLLMVVIPVPVGALFHRLLDKSRRAVPGQVVKKENPD